MSQALELLPAPLPADAQLAAAVQHWYTVKPGVQVACVQLTARQGIIHLTGFTDNLLCRERAEELARAVRGVRGVLNELRMRTAEVTDDELAARVAHQLALLTLTANQPIGAAVRQGEVTLTGVVDSWLIKQWVLRAVKQVAGVWGLKDQLTYPAALPRMADTQLAFYLGDQLAWDAHVQTHALSVRAIHGQVVLGGLVDSDYSRSRVLAAAWAAGAAAVDAEQLLVGYWNEALPRLQPLHLLLPDVACAQAVLDTLRLDARLSVPDIAVTVTNGVVTLSGAVRTLRTCRVAGQAARSTVGVRQVNNYLRVWPRYQPDNQELRAALQSAQAHDPDLRDLRPAWEVQHGRVVVRGSVPGHFEQQRLEELAESVPGVLAVLNRLCLMPRPVRRRQRAGRPAVALEPAA